MNQMNWILQKFQTLHNFAQFPQFSTFFTILHNFTTLHILQNFALFAPVSICSTKFVISCDDNVVYDDDCCFANLSKNDLILGQLMKSLMWVVADSQ